MTRYRFIVPWPSGSTCPRPTPLGNELLFTYIAGSPHICSGKVRLHPSGKYESSMNKSKFIFVLAIAGALAAGSLLAASTTIRAVTALGQSLPAAPARLVQSGLLLLTILLVAVGIYVRRRGTSEREP